jgi:membrane-associated protease RseP (regulator of RpoE activity)
MLVGAGTAEAQNNNNKGWHVNVPGSNVWVWSGGVGLGQGQLGAQVQSMTDDLRRYFGAPKGQGVLVQRVTKGSPAAKAGLRAGDVILSVNGTKVSQGMEIVTALATQSAGSKVTLKILRNKRQRTLRATLRKTGMSNLKSALKGLKTLDALKHFNIQIPDIQIPDVWSGIQGWKGVNTIRDKQLRKQLEQTQKRMRALERRLKALEKSKKSK